jgi:hypothetical protein
MHAVITAFHRVALSHGSRRPSALAAATADIRRDYYWTAVTMSQTFATRFYDECHAYW